jgi:site-specific DNA-methyltransferase (adenine-specific)
MKGPFKRANASVNQLYYGDNLDILRRKCADETVDLCYIDPPFNSKRNYNQIYNNVGREDRAQAQAFIDTWVWDDRAIYGYGEILDNAQGRFRAQLVELIKGLHAVLGEGSLLAYLVSIALRITEIHRVLKRTGSFYLHCDPTASHYLKLILDAVFVTQGGDYRNEIIWKRTHSHGGAKRYGPIHDVILFYTKSDTYTWEPQHVGYSDEYQEKFFRFQDADGRRYRSTVLTGTGTRNGSSGQPWGGYDPTSVGRHWAIPGYVRGLIGATETVQEALDELDQIGRILWPAKEAGVPQFKQYIDDMAGVALQDIFYDIPPISAQSAERLGYPTQKPEALLERIIRASSVEGDTVLDAYCGCGTTIVLAQKLKRQWIGMDITYQSISLVLRRLENAFDAEKVSHIQIDGIPRDMASAQALAHKQDDRLRKEFEKWAVLTYTNNRAVINEKKGADAGVDARAFFKTGRTDNAKIIFQVKSGAVQRGDIAKLRGDMEREQAALAIFLTLDEPTRNMLNEAKSAGQYRHEDMGRSYDRISAVTIDDIINGKRLEIPMSLEVLKAAQRNVDEQQLPLI